MEAMTFVYILLITQALAIIFLGISIIGLKEKVERLEDEIQYWRLKHDWSKLFHR